MGTVSERSSRKTREKLGSLHRKETKAARNLTGKVSARRDSHLKYFRDDEEGRRGRSGVLWKLASARVADNILTSFKSNEVYTDETRLRAACTSKAGRRVRVHAHTRLKPAGAHPSYTRASEEVLFCTFSNPSRPSSLCAR